MGRVVIRVFIFHCHVIGHNGFNENRIRLCHNEVTMKKLFFFFLLVFFLSACALRRDPGQTPSELASQTPALDPTPTATATPAPTPTDTPKPLPSPTPELKFSFVVTSDMSHYSAPEYIDYPNFFAALLRQVEQVGPGDFMVSTGDVIPAEGTSWTIDQVLGEDYPWFPLPGNHDFGRAEVTFFKSYNFPFDKESGPTLVQWGPESCPRTTYSFDFGNAHFVALNVYCDAEVPWGIDGSVTDTLYTWLEKDLAATDKAHVFVFGHEPAFPQPDDETGEVRHLGDSLDQYPAARDRFWLLLQEHDVLAYIHGHSHTYSSVKIEGIWQLNAGQAMGVRAAPSPGTFLMVTIQGERVNLETYRGEEGPGFNYRFYEEIQLRP
jgi:hypothetical protein